MHDLATDVEVPKEGQNLFQLRSLGFSYADGHRALQDIDLDIFPGDRIALVGQNGAGKTTLVRHLNGIYTNQAGSLLIQRAKHPGRQPHSSPPASGYSFSGSRRSPV